MELYVPEYTYYVVELWQEFITRLIRLLLNRNLEENVGKTLRLIICDCVFHFLLCSFVKRWCIA